MSDALRNFASRLLQGTNAGNVVWKPDEAGGFTATASHGSVWIRESESSSGGLVTALRLLAQNGETIDEIATDPDAPGPWQPWEKTIMQLYEAAEASAKGTHDLIDRLTADWNLPREDDDIPF